MPDNKLLEAIGSIEGRGDIKAQRSNVPTEPNTQDKASNSPQKRMSLRPTLSNHTKKSQEMRASNPVYSEEYNGSVNKAVQSASPGLVAVGRLKNMDAAGRAAVGSRVGATVGLSTQGTIGGILGAAVGAYAGRAAGLVQSGVHKDNQRKAQVIEAFDRLGIRNKKSGRIEFSDGGFAELTPERVFGTESGKPGKSDLEAIDLTSPFARRTASVARPIARYISEGLLGETSNKDDESSQRGIDNTTAMIMNSLQDGAEDVETIYNRAKQISGKLGLSAKQAREFFHQRRGTFGEDERLDIESGLDILYGKK